MPKSAKFFIDEFKNDMGGRENMVHGIELELSRMREEDTEFIQMISHYAFAIAATNVAMEQLREAAKDVSTPIKINVAASPASPQITITEPSPAIFTSEINEPTRDGLNLQQLADIRMREAEKKVTHSDLETHIAILVTILMNLEHCGFISMYDRPERKARKIMKPYVSRK